MKTKIIFLIFLFSLIFMSACSSGPGEQDALAECLTLNDAKMYGTEWCHNCKDQKKVFGSSFKYVDYIDCDKEQESCIIADIEAYPTWVIDGENYVGKQDLGRLGYLSNCS